MPTLLGTGDTAVHKIDKSPCDKQIGGHNKQVKNYFRESVFEADTCSMGERGTGRGGLGFPAP